MNSEIKQILEAVQRGEMDVDDDATWEEYLMGLNDIGLERYVEIYNEAYQVSPLQWGA